MNPLDIYQDAKRMTPTKALVYWRYKYREAFGEYPENSNPEQAYIHRWVRDICGDQCISEFNYLDIPYRLLPERYHWIPILWTYRYHTYRHSIAPGAIATWIQQVTAKDDRDYPFAPGDYEDLWDFIGDHTDNLDLRVLGIPYTNPRRDWPFVPPTVQRMKARAYKMAENIDALEAYKDLYHFFQLLPWEKYDPEAKKMVIRYLV